jgi:succinate-semialdehyde dehydrogenase / glutarate-semialdehyde dehydrogenase
VPQPRIEVINPATEEHLATYEFLSDPDLQEKVKKAHQAYTDWRQTPVSERVKYISKLAEKLLEDKEEYAKLMTSEMGKPILQSIAEIEKCATCCDYYAKHGEEMLRDDVIQTDYKDSRVVAEPLGVVYAVMPWNFPFWQVIRCAVPAITAGNAVILKHAENVPGCSVALEQVFKKAGFPEHLFTSVFITHEQSDKLIGMREISAVSLTGSERAGSTVASAASKGIKKSVLELGGSDPFIVLEDADIKYTVKHAVNARMQNTGQSCIAAKRFIVRKEIAEEFTNAFIESIKKQRIGNPLEKETQIGPLARKDLRDTLHKQIQESVKAGAKILLGGEPIPGKGYYYRPTIISEIPRNSPAYRDELFGPAASLFVVESDEEAIEIANDTTFGLGASVWTKDLERAKKMAGQIVTGNVYINTIVKSDPRLPFGGTKASGYGRELGSYGLHEFVNFKTVVVG